MQYISLSTIFSIIISQRLLLLQKQRSFNAATVLHFSVATYIKIADSDHPFVYKFAALVAIFSLLIYFSFSSLHSHSILVHKPSNILAMKRSPLLYFLFFLNLMMFSEASAQTNTQTVTGTVIDKASERPVPNVSVQLVGSNIGARTDSSGRFVLHNVLLGRQQISFTSIGYKTIVIPEVLITAGKQVVLDIPLEQQISSLEEVTVTSRRTRKGMASNEFAGSSARSFSMDEVTRYAGGRNDPSRLVSNFAGVATTNDSRNDIVVRGNAPTAVLWRMEGIPIPESQSLFNTRHHRWTCKRSQYKCPEDFRFLYRRFLSGVR